MILQRQGRSFSTQITTISIILLSDKGGTRTVMYMRYCAIVVILNLYYYYFLLTIIIGFSSGGIMVFRIIYIIIGRRNNRIGEPSFFRVQERTAVKE